MPATYVCFESGAEGTPLRDAKNKAGTNPGLALSIHHRSAAIVVPMMPAHMPVLDNGRRDGRPGLIGNALAARADILAVHALAVALVEQRVEAGARIEHGVAGVGALA